MSILIFATAMEPREIFKIIVKTAGLIVLLYAMYDLLWWIVCVTHLYESKAPQLHLVFGIVMAITGLLIMCGVIPIVDIAYLSEDIKEIDSSSDGDKVENEDEKDLTQ